MPLETTSSFQFVLSYSRNKQHGGQTDIFLYGVTSAIYEMH
jgi:hypothetical protein